jgi:hypothetical protein
LRECGVLVGVISIKKKAVGLFAFLAFQIKKKKKKTVSSS